MIAASLFVILSYIIKNVVLGESQTSASSSKSRPAMYYYGDHEYQSEMTCIQWHLDWTVHSFSAQARPIRSVRRLTFSSLYLDRTWLALSLAESLNPYCVAR